VKTNVVTAVEITDRYAHDSPYLKPLVDKTVENGFKLSEVSADKGYLAANNFLSVLRHGAMPYVPFKTNSVPQSGYTPKSTLWTRMYHFYSYNQERFMQSYHKRSNVETTLHMIGGSEQNAGAGLFFIMTIAYFNRDPFMVYSGGAMYKLLKRQGSSIVLRADPFEDKHSRDTNLPCWKGVVVGIDIGLDNTSAFANILEVVKKFYFQNLKEKKKERYRKFKKPIFTE